MTRHLFAAATSVLVLAALPAVAQTAAPAPKVAIPGGVFLKGIEPGQYAAKDRLIGANVVNKDGVVIGDIKDVILNNANEVEGVILGTGGILGAGEKEVGVRYRSLDFVRKDGQLVIRLPDATKDVIATLEPFNHTGRKSLAQKAMDKAQALKDKTTAGAGPALEKAKAAAGPMLEKAKAAAGTALEKAKELGQEAIDKGKEAVDAAKDKAAPAGSTPPPAEAPKP